jgi:hypothetical protein
MEFEKIRPFFVRTFFWGLPFDITNCDTVSFGMIWDNCSIDLQLDHCDDDVRVIFQAGVRSPISPGWFELGCAILIPRLNAS